MSRKADWLCYAAETKTTINKLRDGKKTQRQLIESMLDSYVVAKGYYSYPGTLAEWEFVVESVEDRPSTRA